MPEFLPCEHREFSTTILEKEKSLNAIVPIPFWKRLKYEITVNWRGCADS